MSDTTISTSIDVAEFLEAVTEEVARINDLDVEDVEVSLDSSLIEALELDSLGILELVLCLQSRYDATIEEADVKGSSTVGDFLKLVERGRA
ncbi:acyl carrier protein [Rhodococcus sp. (in: high G+C Gram-positive bacteria)]|uniref:acyl carrier protein n=1 Tax=Rhodococcus sp. TaxID=1831 RepID=UPI003B8A6D7F